MGKIDKASWSPKSIHSLADLRKELDTIKSAQEAGTLTTTGNWSVGQNLEHCAVFMKSAVDGFDMKMPFPFRVLGTLMKPMLTNPKGQMKPGFKTGPELVPQPAVSFEDGFAKMNDVVTRLEAGEQMTHNSPFVGKMTHEKWMGVQLNHCRMHFGFFKYD